MNLLKIPKMKLFPFPFSCPQKVPNVQQQMGFLLSRFRKWTNNGRWFDEAWIFSSVFHSDISQPLFAIFFWLNPSPCLPMRVICPFLRCLALSEKFLQLSKFNFTEPVIFTWILEEITRFCNWTWKQVTLQKTWVFFGIRRHQ